jgi:hypothetical protein
MYLYNKFHIFNLSDLFLIIEIKWKTNLESSQVALARIKVPILHASPKSLCPVILDQNESDDKITHHVL